MQGLVVLILIVSVLFLVILLFYRIFLYVEKKILFLPLTEHVWTPLQPYRDIRFTSTPLHAWYFPIKRNSGSQPPRVVLFCHGNTGNISHRKYVVDLCHEMGLSLFLFDYQGYGKSGGSPNLDTLKHDGDAAYNHLISLGYSSQDIIVWGESLGGIVASHIASKHACYRLILMATFSSLSSLSETSFLGSLVYPFLLVQGESNLKRIQQVKCPVLVIHSEEDEIIPHWQGLELYRNIKHTWKAFLSIKGSHGAPYLTLDLVKEIMRFCWQEPYLSPQCEDILTYIANNDHKHGH